MGLDGIDHNLLGLLQARFPLTPKPYTDLGLNLGISEAEIISRIRQMKKKGLVRQISPVLDPRSLGFKTTLVAMRVKDILLDRTANFLAEHPGVSHAYERDHYFNLWFTLAVPSTIDTNIELIRLADIIKADAVIDLPTIKSFKLRTYFGLDEDDQPEMLAETPEKVIRREVYLSPIDRKVINELQQDLPLISQPFAEISAHLGVDEKKLLTQCQSLLSRGIIRRFGASVNHRRIGFAANAMTCWAVPEEMVEIMAKRLVPLRQVSHCYERKTNSLWHYNLFAMIHGHTREQCLETVEKLSATTGLRDNILLFSTREFKKTRVIFQV